MGLMIYRHVFKLKIRHVKLTRAYKLRDFTLSTKTENHVVQSPAIKLRLHKCKGRVFDRVHLIGLNCSMASDVHKNLLFPEKGHWLQYTALYYICCKCLSYTIYNAHVLTLYMTSRSRLLYVVVYDACHDDRHWSHVVCLGWPTGEEYQLPQAF
jgi:hypothetical protein